MNYQIIIEIILALIASAGIIVAAIYVTKHNLLQNTIITTIISIIENNLSTIPTLLSNPEVQIFYNLLVDAISAIVTASTTGESQADIVAAIVKFLHDGLLNIPNFPVIPDDILANIVNLVIALVQILGVANFVKLSRKVSFTKK